MSDNLLYKKYLKIFWILFMSSVLFITLMFLLISTGLFGYMPSFEELENPKSNLASEIYSSDNVLVGTYYVENRSNIKYSQITPHLVNALIATEDARFRKHSGVDTRALFRVIFGVMTGTNK